MKKSCLYLAAMLCTYSSFAQNQEEEIIRPDAIIPVEYMGLTGNLIDFTEAPGTVNEVTKTLKHGYHPKDDWILNESVNPNALPQGEDPALQKVYPLPATPTRAMTQNWDAISNFNVSPADPAVDVGPNHVVHMTNGPSGAYIQVYSKTGTPIGSQIYFDNFMSMAGGLGDPIVLYDERADRWMLSEFSDGGDNMHVAISQTADPTGAYHKFVFNAPNFPDYPKFSIWQDAYLITTNEAGDAPIYAINRADLLAGTPTTAQRFTIPAFNTIGFQAATPVSLLGTTLPPANTPPMVMRMRDDAWAGVSSDALEIYNVNLDWNTPGNSSVTTNIILNMGQPFDSELCGYTSFECIDQPGSPINLDPLREVLMNRIMYRNFGTHESIVCCHITDVNGNDRAGIRWYELRRTGGGAWSIYQESTYSPDADSRWMPTIGISASGKIGLAYNVSSGSTYPSLRYTGRKECDPLNQMTEPETNIAAGTTANGSNRYGDYNAMGVDPSDGETFYMTGVYNPNMNGVTRIAAFNIDMCNQQQPPTATFTSSNNAICAGASIAFTDGSTNTPTSWAWDFGDGNTSTQQNPGHTFATAGTYTVSLTATNAHGSNTATQTITVNAAPTVTATGSTSICSGSTATLNAAGANSYSWSNGSTGASVTVNPTSTTTYTVTGTDGNGCTNTAQITVTVNADPVISLNAANNPVNCGTNTGSIVINGTGTGNVSWSGTATGSSNGVSFPYTIPNLGAGNYTINYTDNNGCNSNTLTQALTDPNAPNVAINGPASICQGFSTQLTATGASTYSWNNGQTGQTITVSPTSTTTYTVTGTDGSGCANTTQITLTVNPLPTVSITPATIDTMCLNGSGPITLVGSPSGGTFLGTGVSGSTFTPASAGVGSHTITYNYTDANGCQGTSTVVAVVDACAGIAEPSLEGVELFPNPNEGIFTITGLEMGTEYTIYDAKGRLIVSDVVTAEQEQIEIPNVSGGVYYLHATANGKQGSLNFLIAR